MRDRKRENEAEEEEEVTASGRRRRVGSVGGAGRDQCYVHCIGGSAWWQQLADVRVR